MSFTSYDLPVFKYKKQNHYYRSMSPERKKELLNKAKVWRYNNKEKAMFISAKQRAINKGLAFNIELSDIVIPTHCPVLGIILEMSNTSRQRDTSPSLDRIDNSKGYIKGNIVVVSFKANKIKTDASVEEIGKVYNFYKELLTP